MEYHQETATALPRTLTPAAKAATFWLLFLGVYLAYRAFPLAVLTPLAGINESNFQHYKAAFACYALVCAGEWMRLRPEQRSASFIYSRLAACVFLPWIIFLLWYLAPALIGRWPSTLLEIVWANAVVITAGGMAATLERSLAAMPYPPTVRRILLGLFLVSILIYLVFTYRLPWADVFVEPIWR